MKHRQPRQAGAFGSSLAVLGVLVLGTGCSAPVEDSPVNNPPTITALQAREDTVDRRESCPIECVASDGDGDELTYEWWASGGDIDFGGATAVWRAPEQRGTYDIAVRVSDGNDGEASEAIPITVEGNDPPVIAGLKAGVEWLTPSNSCRVECDAEDPDGDQLSYEWLVRGGRILGTGPVAMWVAPEIPGLQYIAVNVTDGYGGRARGALAIRVLSPEPPSIEDLRLTFQHPEYVKKYPWGYRILKGKLCVCQMECTAVDWGKELTYRWTCDSGEISGSGSVATWTPPDTKSEGTVGVTVSDVMGNTASTAIFFRAGEMGAYAAPTDGPGGCCG